MHKENALKYLDDLIIEGQDVLATKGFCTNEHWDGLLVVDENALSAWRQGIVIFLDSLERPKNEFNEIDKSTIRPEYNKAMQYMGIVKSLKRGIETDVLKLDSRQTISSASANTKKIFIGHGHDLLWARIGLYLKEKYNLELKYYEDGSRAGQPITDSLEQLLDNIDFAILMFMRENQTNDGEWHARENVLDEYGRCIAKLGNTKVAMIVEEGVVPHSNTDGINHIRYKNKNVDAVFHKLDEMLRREGII